MPKSTLPSRHQSPRWEPKYPFDLVVAYEDTATRDQAMQLYDHLAQSLLDDYDFQCSWWRFDHFRAGDLRSQASDAAAEANMIILCLRSGDQIPAQVCSWIEQWLPRKDDRKSALVSLIADVDHPHRDRCPANLYLQNVARLAKMDFFSHSFTSERSATLERSTTLAAPLVDPSNRLASLMGGVYELRTETPRWGINE